LAIALGSAVGDFDSLIVGFDSLAHPAPTTAISVAVTPVNTRERLIGSPLRDGRRAPRIRV